MDNKQTPPAFDLAQIVKHCQSFLETAKTGEGLGLNDEQKEQFKKGLAENSQANDAMKDLEKKIENLKNMVNHSTGKK